MQQENLLSSAKVSEGKMEKIVALCKRRGFVFPSSEIYGGFANAWDYGPLGVELKNNIKQLWWQRFVRSRTDMVGIDAALIMNPKVWEASGHVATFSDPLVECKNCHTRFRVDKLIEDEGGLSIIDAYHDYINQWWMDLRPRIDTSILESKKSRYQLEKELAEIKLALVENGVDPDKIPRTYKTSLIKYKFTKPDHLDLEIIEYQKLVSGGVSSYIHELIKNKNLTCSNCKEKDFTQPTNFNLMFKTFIGPSEDQTSTAYFRPETAQAMFVNFKNVLDTMRKKLPFGIAQQGKAFRNEITPGNFIFRTREFEQMEIEYFFAPPKDDSEWQEIFEMWRTAMIAWMKEDLRLDFENHVHELEVEKADLAHYSKRTIDFEYDFPFGTKELYGLAYRTDFDLANHEKASGQEMKYLDPETNEKFTPHCIEPTWGVDRTILAVLCEHYKEEGEGDKKRVYLSLPPRLAPYKCAVFPLLKNKPELVEKARSIYSQLATRNSLLPVAWDDRGNVGKRYYSQDEIGTPFCITVDFQTLEDDTVTVRDRDTQEQVRVSINKIFDYLQAYILK